MPTAEVFFYISIPLWAGADCMWVFPKKLIISWTDLEKYPGSHLNKLKHPEPSPPTKVWGAKELCETHWPTEYRFNRQERLHMINCSYLYLWVGILSVPGLSPFYFIISPLLETEEQKSIAWVLASHRKLKGHAFQFQLKKHSCWADVIHQTPVG